MMNSSLRDRLGWLALSAIGVIEAVFVLSYRTAHSPEVVDRYPLVKFEPCVVGSIFLALGIYVLASTIYELVKNKGTKP